MTKLLVLASVLSGSIASAQPSVTAATDVTAPSRLYVQGGAVAGGIDQGGVYGALAVDAGYRLAESPLWLHGQLAAGGMAGVDETTMASDFKEARAGVEARSCSESGVACGVLGVDLGMRRAMLDAQYDHFQATDAIAVMRGVVDIGGAHLRVRPGIEYAVSPSGHNAFGLSLGVAYTF